MCIRDSCNDGSDNTTTIEGIANQRVKECNRIEAMVTELAKFGVKANELPDGIQVHGVHSISDLKMPSQLGIDTYDDHRVAMSFSLLAGMVNSDKSGKTVQQSSVRILERHCTGKTWPGWWDVLHSELGAKLDGAEPINSSKTSEVKKSVVIIGMRAAGKTTVSKWCASSLGYKLLDLDDEFERQYGKGTVKEFVAEQGWDAFRKEETRIFKETIEKYGDQGYVISSGGGIVERDESRKELQKFASNNGIVLHLHRDIEETIVFLKSDPSRPAYIEEIKDVWERREKWYHECSNFTFFAPHCSSDTEFQNLRKVFNNYIRRVLGSSQVDVPSKRSAFVCLTFSDLTEHVTKLCLLYTSRCV